MKADVTVIRKSGPLSLYRMLALNAVVCGLEFCVSAAFCYIPPLLLKAGISEQHMTLVLAVGPTLGFCLVPVIGRSSDKCRSRFGRRRPYILGLSVALVLSLILLAYGDSLGVYVFGAEGLGDAASVGLLVVGSVVLDFSCQAGLTPCEALLSDASKDSGQHDRCFTIYSLAVSVGGCVGYLITALDWDNSVLGEYVGNQERTVFLLLVVLYLISLLTTFTSFTEVPLPAVELISNSTTPAGHLHGPLSSDVLPSPSDSATVCDPGYVSDDMLSSDDSVQIHMWEKHKRLKPSENIPAIMAGFGNCFNLVEQLRISIWTRVYNSLPYNVKALLGVPLVLRRLALANFCSWTAVMAFNLFYTDFVGQVVYQGDPYAPESSPELQLYDEGVRAGSWGLLFRCVAAGLYAPAVESVVARVGLRTSYLAGMLSFSATMLAMLMTKNIYIVNALAACSGIAFATMTSVPFMLVTSYHSSRELYFYDTQVGASIPLRGFGTDLSTLDSAYFLSQVILTVCMGSIVHYTQTVSSYIMFAALIGVLSCIAIYRVVGDKFYMQALIKANTI